MQSDEKYKKMVHKAIKNKFPGEKFTLEKLLGGIINHVFLAKSEKREVVVRINYHFRFSDFKKEKWAFEQCRKKRVPVPQFVYLDTTRKIIPSDYVIYKKAEGKPLSSYIKGEKIPKKDIPKFLPTMEQVGFYMSKIHQVKTEGYGYLQQKNNNFHGIQKTIQGALMPSTELSQLVKKKILAKRFSEKIFNELVWKSLNFKSKSVLLHMDLNANNILVDDKMNIIVIVDMENALSGDPIMEFARLERFYYEYPEILKAVKRGYRNKSIFKGDFNEKLRIYSVKYNSDLLPFYYKQKNMKKFRKIEKHIKMLLH